MDKDVRTNLCLFVFRHSKHNVDSYFKIALLIIILFASRIELQGATYRTANFIVSAPTEEFSKQVGNAAEKYRRELAIHWLGTPLPQWSSPCPVRVKVGARLGAGGETSFTFANGEVYGWKMKIQGNQERILDSVLPHEVSHMILASHFRQPVPRWIDEGAATSVEVDQERSNYRRMLVEFLQTERGIPFNDMVQCEEYPADQMPFYAQGFSVCEYLLAVGGPRRLIEFAQAAMAQGSWSGALSRYYGYENLGDLQLRWQGWVREWFVAGMPATLPKVESLIAANEPASTPDPIRLVAGEEIRQESSSPQSYGQLIPNAVPDKIAHESDSTVDPPLVAGDVFDRGVGTAVPSGISVVSAAAPLRYQGSYGQSLREVLELPESEAGKTLPLEPSILRGQTH